jgi:hypothetical protein
MTNSGTAAGGSDQDQSPGINEVSQDGRENTGTVSSGGPTRSVERRLGSGAPVAVRAAAVGAVAAGALAGGALAVGALAVGALAIGRLRVCDAALRRLRIGQLEVDELRVRRLRVAERD